MNSNCKLSPCNKTVFFPVGAFNASWSKVRISPPAFKMRALAPEVTRNAQTCQRKIVIMRALGSRGSRQERTVSLGTLYNLLSSTIVPTTTAIRFSSAILVMYLEIALNDIGGRLIRDMNRRLNTTLLKWERVRRAKKRYNYKAEND